MGLNETAVIDELCPGRLLGRQAVAARIAKGDIFAGDWHEANLRGAAYDLRLARDYLITPDGQAFGPGAKREKYEEKALILKPGDVAHVATREKLKLGWNIAANIGTKYDVTVEGLFVFHGALVDPGYGIEQDDERLHFLITNVGSKRCVLLPGEHRIASLQFFEVEPVPECKRVKIRSAAGVWRSMVEDPIDSSRLTSGLEFFDKTAKRSRDLQRRVDRLERLKGQVEQLDVANERVVAFGIYVLAAALLGMSLAALVAIAGGEDRAVTVNFEHLGSMGFGGAVCLVVAIALGVGLGIMLGMGLVSMARGVYRGRRG